MCCSPICHHHQFLLLPPFLFLLLSLHGHLRLANSDNQQPARVWPVSYPRRGTWPPVILVGDAPLLSHTHGLFLMRRLGFWAITLRLFIISGQQGHFWSPHSISFKGYRSCPVKLPKKLHVFLSIRPFPANFLTNDALLRRIDTRLVILVSFPLIWDITCLCLKKIWKSRFMRSSCQFKIYIDLHAELTGVKIENREHQPTRFGTTNLVAVLEFKNELSLENTFFEVSPLQHFTWKFDSLTSGTLF